SIHTFLNMKGFNIIALFTLCNLLFSENINEQIINDNPESISLMDTSGLDPKLMLFLNKFYQKNYVDDTNLKKIKSIQFVGTYYVNGEEVGTVKIIKKRPNKYKSYIKKYDDTETIIIFDGQTLKSKDTTGTDPTIQWQTLDVTARENLWIHFEQIFDSVLLSPKDPNKTFSLGIPFKEDDQVHQAITVELKNKIKTTHFIPIRDNLIKKTLIEFNDPEDSHYNSYTIYFEDYESINDIMFAKKIRTQVDEDHSVAIEVTSIEFNLGISDFFFKAVTF
ncbi:MAG: hypothetical protein O2827_01800, partial [Verrucomicrobia bacterium]|nr:hypothetical protein [Verrucomicrobiota bacterium]